VLRQLEKAAPDVALTLHARSQAIAFRNVLIHSYDSIDDRIVWRTIHESLPALRARVAALLDEMGRAKAEEVAKIRFGLRRKKLDWRATIKMRARRQSG
jgi:hypothetical protein